MPRAGIAFIVAAVVAALLSSAPSLSIIGPYATGSSVLLFVAVVGFHAAGRRSASPSAQLLVGRALLASAAINAGLAVLQARLDLSSYGLEIVESRSAALLGNPVHLATLLAGAFPLVWSRMREAKGRGPSGLLVILLAAGAQVSGSRFLLLALGLAALAILVRHRNLAATAFAIAVVSGLLIGAFIGHRPDFAGASDRITQVGVAEGSTMQRLYTWRESIPTVLERPLLGFGPGRYLQATARHRSTPLAKAGPDSYFADAHNLFVDIAVGTGLVGLAAFLAWLVLAVRGARGPCLWSALALLGMHLVEPAHPGTTPLIGLMLGVGSTEWIAPALAKSISVIATSIAATVGVLLGGTILIGDLRLQEARLDANRQAAKGAADQLPPWPEVSDAVARLIIFDAVVARDDRLWEEAVEWERRAVEADPSDPRWWVLAGLVEAKAGQTNRAEASFRMALRLNQYSCGAWDGLGRLHVTQPSDVGAARLCRS